MTLVDLKHSLVSSLRDTGGHSASRRGTELPCNVQGLELTMSLPPPLREPDQAKLICPAGVHAVNSLSPAHVDAHTIQCCA